MRDVETLVKILIDNIENNSELIFREEIQCLCRLTYCLVQENIISDEEELFLDKFLHNEIKFIVYPGFESILYESVNNHTEDAIGGYSSYFFKVGIEIRLEWLKAVLVNIQNKTSIIDSVGIENLSRIGGMF